MSEEKALEVAASFISEAFVFTVAVLIVLWEYSSTSAKNTLKAKQEEERQEELRVLLREQAKEHSQETAQLQSIVAALEARQNEMDTRIAQLYFAAAGSEGQGLAQLIIDPLGNVTLGGA